MRDDSGSVREKLEERNLRIYKNLVAHIEKFREDHPEITGFDDFEDLKGADPDTPGDVTLKNTKILQFILSKDEIKNQLADYPELALVLENCIDAYHPGLTEGLSVADTEKIDEFKKEINKVVESSTELSKEKTAKTPSLSTKSKTGIAATAGIGGVAATVATGKTAEVLNTSQAILNSAQPTATNLANAGLSGAANLGSAGLSGAAISGSASLSSTAIAGATAIAGSGFSIAGAAFTALGTVALAATGPVGLAVAGAIVVSAAIAGAGYAAYKAYEHYSDPTEQIKNNKSKDGKGVENLVEAIAKIKEVDRRLDSEKDKPTLTNQQKEDLTKFKDDVYKTMDKEQKKLCDRFLKQGKDIDVLIVDESQKDNVKNAISEAVDSIQKQSEINTSTIDTTTVNPMHGKPEVTTTRTVDPATVNTMHGKPEVTTTSTVDPATVNPMHGKPEVTTTKPLVSSPPTSVSSAGPTTTTPTVTTNGEGVTTVENSIRRGPPTSNPATSATMSTTHINEKNASKKAAKGGGT